MPLRKRATGKEEVSADTSPVSKQNNKSKPDEKFPIGWLLMLSCVLGFALWMQFGEGLVHDSFVDEIDALTDDTEFEDEDDPLVLSDQLLDFLDPIIEGSGIADPIPDVAQRKLDQFNGDAFLASKAIIDTYRTPLMKLKTFIIGSIPVLGLPASLVDTLWRQLRLVGLIASVNGHDVSDSEVQSQMLMALVERDMEKVPRKVFSTVSKDIICKFVAKKLTKKFAAKGVKFAVKLLPIGGVLDVLMDDTPEIGRNAQMAFGTEPIDVPPHSQWAAYALYSIVAICAGRVWKKKKLFILGWVGLIAVLFMQVLFDTWQLWGEEL